jgi:hypothetical protein
MNPFRRRFALLAFLAFSLMGTGLFRPAAAQEITRVEEDWRVRVVQPDAEITAPQFTAVMVPDGTDDSTYFSVEFNHSSWPEFDHGGMQLQVWRFDEFEAASDRMNENTLGTHEESIAWTQYAERDGTSLVVGLSELHSHTLGSGFDAHTARLVLPNYGGDLSRYDHRHSLELSAVGFSSNRVAYMSLVEVRTYSGDELVQRITVDKNVNRGQSSASEE